MTETETPPAPAPAVPVVPAVPAAPTAPPAPTAPTELRPEDRRAFPRRKVKGTFAYRPASKPMAFAIACKGVDVSPDGIGLLVNRPLAIGDEIELEIQPLQGSKMIRIATVR